VVYIIPYILTAVILVWGLTQYWKLAEAKKKLNRYIHRVREASNRAPGNLRVHYEALIRTLENILGV
jgi:hypothetical protein